MTIPASEVWIIAAHDTGRPASPEGDIAAPDEFEDIDAIESYIQSEYGVGEYSILLPERTVEVTPEQEMFANYTEEDMAVIEDAQTHLDNHEDTITASVISDPTLSDRHMDFAELSLRAPPFAYDVVAEVLTNGDDPQDVVSEMESLVPELHVLGWKKQNHYERRGARPDKAVRIYFTRLTPPLRTLRELAADTPEVLAVYDAETVTFMPRVLKQTAGHEADAVAVFHKAIGTDQPQLLNPDGLDVSDTLLETYESEANAFEAAVEELADWEITSLGVIPRQNTDAPFYFGVGLQHDDPQN